MRDQVNALLYDIGLERNDVQVFEDTDLTGQLMYPNFFSAKDYTDIGVSDEELVDTIINLMEQHLETIKEQLAMVRRFKTLYEEPTDTEEDSGSPAVV